jgi:flagellar P-ring protein FlgI
MEMMLNMMKKCLTPLVLLMTVQAALAVKIADISTLQGQRENRLMTVGLIVGLNGSGDNGKFLPAIQPLIAFLQHFGSDRLDLESMKGVKNVALVSVEAQVGGNGAREGQQLDVVVSAIGSAKSLKGGRLLLIPMMGPNKADPTVYALASGPVNVYPNSPTTGVIKNGATMEQDVINIFIRNNSFTLVLDDAHATWSMASTIAETINEAISVQHAQQQIAKALDPKNILVVIPNTELKDPANFIAWIQSLPLLMPEKSAQVTINAGTGTVIADDNVTISPVTISYKGMTISTEMLVKQLKDQAEKSKQAFEMPEFVNLSLLIDAMNYLTMPVEDRIAIIRELARTGNLQGQLVEQP